MTVADLIAELRRFPAHAPVTIMLDEETIGDIRDDVSESIVGMGIAVSAVEASQTHLGYGVAIVAA